MFGAAVKSLRESRESVRTVLSDAASLQAFGISEPVPSDVQELITHAKSNSTMATKQGYDTEPL